MPALLIFSNEYGEYIHADALLILMTYNYMRSMSPEQTDDEYSIMMTVLSSIHKICTYYYPTYGRRDDIEGTYYLVPIGVLSILSILITLL